ncbi:isoleucyl-trna synthetase family protein [Cystoisospora suis]|uniref:isoleucine--tRNA ligase n=1 Tax=Cystoisospora suis TaxID=483139 RepID=A0A2C6LBB6_9APIC|nr:isoleucyl-trna synthetase family protein [Cystoisospora suis]
MSKRLKNYPDPMDVVNEYGADALRLYLVNSPVVRAETLRFRVEGVKDVVKDVLLPWYHACRFLVQEVIRCEVSSGRKFTPCLASDLLDRANNMDRWILSASQSLVKFVHQEMQAYRLYTVIPRLIHFLGQLTNWYVRLNRDRMRGAMGEEEALVSLQTLYDVLMTTVLCMAPLTPYMSELLYQTLKRALPDGHPLKAETVHFLMVPDLNEELLDSTLERQMGRMQTVINLGRTMRERQRVPVKTPVRSVTVLHADPEYVCDIQTLEAYVKEELNTIDLEVSDDKSSVILSAVPNFKALGSRLGKDMKAVQEAVKNLSHEDLEKFEIDGKIVLLDGKHELGREDLLLQRTFKGDDKKQKGDANTNLVVEGDNSVAVLIDFTPDDSLQRKATAREVANRVQKLRKQYRLQQTDEVEMIAHSPDVELQDLIQAESSYITKCLRRDLHIRNELPTSNGVCEGRQAICHESVDINGKPLIIVFHKLN